MISILSHVMGTPQAGIGKVIVGEAPKPDNRETVDMTACVFFDGTGNNRTNTELRMAARLANSQAQYAVVEGRAVKLKDSYVCFYSNVAIMEYMTKINDPTTEVSYYTEGIGTENGLDDDTLGSGFGMGTTGVPAKVTKGITEVTKRITKAFEDSDKKLGKLTVNVFGFSRGAAAARHFVARRGGTNFPQYTSLSESLSIPAAAITVHFVGLFDTVSSYGGERHRTLAGQIYNKLVHKSFDDDVKELHLALGGEAAQVVQFTAADEYRKNFASTNILSSVRASVGLEVRLPGVHSDIGGSYEEEKEERRYFIATERGRLVEEGWYTRAQITNLDGYWLEGRRTLTHHYQFIPLGIMVELAQQAGLSFRSFTDKFAAFQVPGPLQALAGQMRSFVLGRPGPISLAPYAPAEFVLPDEFKWVRNQFLHRSAIKGELATESLTMAGREQDGLPNRQRIPDYADAP